MKPAILYAAKSTADKNGSIPEQLRQGAAEAEADGYTIVGQFKDEDKSAYSGSRGGDLVRAKQMAEEMAEQHGECAVFIQHSDRLARGDGKVAAHLVEYALWAIKAGVRIVSLQDPETFQQDDLIYAVLTGKRNHDDSRRKSQATRSGIAKKAREGYAPAGGRRRFGYRWSKETRGLMVPIPEEALIVERRVFDATLGGMTAVGIANELEADGIKTVAGGRWHAGTVSKMLRNAFYKGVVVYDGEEYPGKHEAIVDPAKWDAVAELLGSRASLGRPRRPKNQGAGGGGGRVLGLHLFRKGMLRCVCGGAMLVRSDRRKLADGTEALYETYLCENHRRDAASCPVGPIRRDHIDPQVFRYFERVGVDIDATRRELALAQESRTAEVTALQLQARREAQTAEERLTRVKRDYLEGRITAEDWSGFRDDLTADVEATQAKAARFDEQAATVEGAASVAELEADVLEKLTAIRAALAGEVSDAGGIEAARAALQRLFEGFGLSEPELGRRVPAELAWAGQARYLLEPILREGVIPAPEPLYPSRNNFNVGVVTKNLFAAIPLSNATDSTKHHDAKRRAPVSPSPPNRVGRRDERGDEDMA